MKKKNLNLGKHKDFIKDYGKIKSNHLEKLATKMIKKKDKEDQLKTKIIDKKFLDNF